jgi:hypothetical protein
MAYYISGVLIAEKIVGVPSLQRGSGRIREPGKWSYPLIIARGKGRFPDRSAKIDSPSTKRFLGSSPTSSGRPNEKI